MKSMDNESLNYTISKTLSIIILKEAYFYCFTLLLAQPCQGLPILATRQKFYCKLVAGYEEEPLYVVLPHSKNNNQ